jgi:hypothetical protein
MTDHLTPAARHLAGQIDRSRARLLDPHWAEDLAVLATSSGDIRDGLAALHLLRDLRDQHTAVSWGAGSDVQSCPLCHIGPVCPLTEAIDGVLGGRHRAVTT